MQNTRRIDLMSHPDQIFISVIIPAYNAYDYIQETLYSVLEQTYPNFEVIVINDGSTDRTRELLIDMQKNDSRIKLINQSNQGISAARNAGIERSNGEFITFIDSDDKWHRDFLLKMLKRQKETNADIVYSGNIDISKKGKQPRISDFREEQNLVGYLTQRSLLHVGCLFLKKSFIIKNGIKFNTKFRTGEDILFICSLFCLTTAYSVPEYLYYYIHRDGSIMHNSWTKKNYLDDLSCWQELQKVIESTYNQRDKNNAKELISSKIVYYKLRLLWMLLISGRNHEVIELLNERFLTYNESDLKHLPRKFAKTRRKIIESKSNLLWFFVRLTHKNKFNLT